MDKKELKYCTKCGHPINQDHKFCIKCGAKNVSYNQNTEITDSRNSIQKSEKPNEKKVPERRKKTPESFNEFYSKDSNTSKSNITLYIVLGIIIIGVILYLFVFKSSIGDSSTKHSKLIDSIQSIREVEEKEMAAYRNDSIAEEERLKLGQEAFVDPNISWKEKLSRFGFKLESQYETDGYYDLNDEWVQPTTYTYVRNLNGRTVNFILQSDNNFYDGEMIIHDDDELYNFISSLNEIGFNEDVYNEYYTHENGCPWIRIDGHSIYFQDEH